MQNKPAVPIAFSISPSAGSKLSGIVTLKVTCKPNDAIDRVTFDAPGANPRDVRNDGSGTYEYDWDTTKSTGNSVHLVALDKNSLVLGQAQFTWNVDNTPPPPQFSVTPAPGSKLSGMVTLRITCKPNDAIDRVTFDLPGVNPKDIKNDGSGTYECDWDTTKSVGNSVHLVALDKNSLVLGQAQFTWDVENK